MSDEAGLAAQDQGPRAAYVQDFKRDHLMIHDRCLVHCTPTTVMNSLSKFFGSVQDRSFISVSVCVPGLSAWRAYVFGGPLSLTVFVFEA